MHKLIITKETVQLKEQYNKLCDHQIIMGRVCCSITAGSYTSQVGGFYRRQKVLDQ